MRYALLVVVVALLAAAGCVKQYSASPDGSGSPTAPSPPPAALHTVEFRALGTVTTAHVTYGSAQDGTSDFTGAIPWSARFTTKQTSLFVYIEGAAQSFGEIRVQIFVDGQLFREATADNFGTAQASGTVTTAATSARR
jgi:hypothetical protein